jgi:hypothetical protein
MERLGATPLAGSMISVENRLITSVWRFNLSTLNPLGNFQLKILLASHAF